jgi:hypothetical protein
VLQTINDVLGLYEAGIAECARVLVPGTGRLLVKCQDLTHNHRLHLVFLDVLRRMTAAGVDLADMFILVNNSRMPQPTQRQQRAHRAHSYLLVGVKEPGIPSGDQRRAVERARELAEAAATVQTLAAYLGVSTQHPSQSFYAAYTAAVDRLRDLLASIDQAGAGPADPDGNPAARLRPRRAAGGCAVSRLLPARGAAGGVQRHPGGRRAGRLRHADRELACRLG